VGTNNGTITDCYATGKVTGDFHTGGLVGYNTGTIDQLLRNWKVTGSNGTGGLVGRNNGTITNCYATGNVKAATICAHRRLSGI
jgi:hypothetical protein